MGIVDVTHQLPRKIGTRSSPDDIQQITEARMSHSSATTLQFTLYAGLS